MATNFQATSTYTNLTRIQLEQLRRADASASGKALTVGDAVWAENTPSVGAGNVAAEPFTTRPWGTLEDAILVTPPALPGTLLGTVTQTSDLPSESVRWFGPEHITDGTAGQATAINQWSDFTIGVNFTLSVLPGDLLLVKDRTGGGADNRWVAAEITVVAANTLTVSEISGYHIGGGGSPELSVDGLDYAYVIVRPSAVKLFAVPGSGPLGREQSFMVVTPTSALHTAINPAVDAIDADRITNVIPRFYGADDRADGVFRGFTGPRKTLDLLGYRIVLYPSNGTGTGPDLTQPIATDTPVIDSSLPVAEQRMTVDFKGGIVRFSTPPATGSQIKPAAGCVNPVTGRLELYAVFWAMDTSMTARGAALLWATRGTAYEAKAPTRMAYDPARDAWVVGTTFGADDFFVQSLSSVEDPTGIVQFGALDSTSTLDQRRSFTYRRGRNTWTFNKAERVTASDPLWATEMELGEKLARTVGDITSPPMSQADFNPPENHGGARSTADTLTTVLAQAASDGFGTVHLRKGLFNVRAPLVVPPGITIEGEGPSTRVYSNLYLGDTDAYTRRYTMPTFRFGPNTFWGVYDPSAFSSGLWPVDNDQVTPAKLQFTPANPDQRVEGMDVVWNPARRVWAVVVADVTSNAIWFNEFDTAGNSTFPGLGIDIKNTAEELYTSDTVGVGVDHTPGHYPRIAHNRWVDEYVVVWVEKYTDSGSGDIGPIVALQAHKITPSTTLGGTPSVAYKTLNRIAGPFTFSDHPSVAVFNGAEGDTPTYRVGLSFWSYDVNLTHSKAACAAGNMVAGLIAWSYSVGVDATYAVISSTDVADDGQNGFLYAWSRRTHRLVTGTQGQIYTADGTNVSDLTDSGIPSFTSYGVAIGSKLLLLGLPKDSAWTWDAHNYLSHPDFVSAYGLDCTVMDVSVPGQVRVKSNETGMRVAPATPWKVTNGVGTATIGGTTLTDGTKDFTALGVQVGDVVYRTSDYGDATRRGYVVTVVAPGGDPTKLTVDRVFAGLPAITYDIMVGREFRWAIAPRSALYYCRYSNGIFSSDDDLVGGLSTAFKYRIDTYEPDFVRLSRGGDKWLLVYQSFDTTARLAGKSIRNFDDGIDTSYLDSGEGLDLQEYTAAYREHVATCSLLLNNRGTAASPTSVELAGVTSYRVPRASRDIEVSQRSLGAHDPVTHRPNYYVAREAPVGHYPRHGQHMAREISALNFMHRWTASRAASLLPDVTWSGSDWTVVSPSKEAIHSFTGTYDVNTPADFFLMDPTFYFGFGGVPKDDLPTNSTDAQYLHKTVEPGDQVYFPAIGQFATITKIISEHVVRLDSNPFGFGVSRTPHTEWVLVRNYVNIGRLGGGIKNPGFRVSADGEVVLSTSYTTFADPIPAEVPNPSSYSFYVNRLETMRRVEQDAFQRGITKSYGWNLPANPEEDGFEQQSRYVADVSFQGVAVGEPKTFSRRVPEEVPLCAISWGDNLYGFVDRWKNETENEVRFYRQCFGPYNNSIRNLAIEGGGSVPGTTEMLLLTRQHVYTRHGEPVESTGNFATDGYRNCFVYPDWIVFRSPDTNKQDYGLKAVYTDAFGDNPITLQGPKPQLQVAATPKPLWPASGLYGTYHHLAANPTAPKVLWDGQRFVAAWVEGGGVNPTMGYSDPTMVCLGVFPGDENTALQTTELLDPTDILTDRETAQAIRVDYRKEGAGSYHLTVLDVAFSGKVYAVLWATGLDKGGATSPGAALGVTLFDAVGFESSLDTDLHILAVGASDGVTSNNTTFKSDTGFFQTRGVRKYDILSINDGAGRGKYRIMANPAAEDTLTLDRQIPTGADQEWTVYRRKPPSAGRTYVLGVMAGKVDASVDPEEPRDAYVNPHIVWDGKQFAAVWRGKTWLPAGTRTGRALQRQFIPESGLGTAPQIVKMAAPQQYLTTTDPTVSNNVSQGLGYLEAANPAVWIRLNGTYDGSGTPTNMATPDIRPGDTLVISSVHDLTAWPGITHEFDGWYRITEYDPSTNSVRLYAQEFGDTSFPAEGTFVVYGAILSTGVGDPGQTYSKTAGAGLYKNLPETPETLSASPGIIANNDWGNASLSATSVDPQYVYGLVYNEKRDEYAVLYQGNNTVVLFGFKRGQTASRPAAIVNLSEVYTAALGWNGQNYLVVWSDMSFNVYWNLFSQDFALVDSGTLCAAPGSGGTNLDLIGTLPDQQPGPVCYGGYNDSLRIKPRPRNVCIQWNSRLGRWAVSLSMLWHSDEVTAGNTYQLVNRYYLYGPGGGGYATVVSWTDRTMTFSDGEYIGYYAQPGCKLVFTTGVDNVAAFTILASDPVAKTITIDATQISVAGFTAFDPTGMRAYIVPREDVWVYTLGYVAPAVQMLDADGSSLENVTISGSSLDIEERYNHMARPIWQAGGPPVGSPIHDLLTLQDQSALQRRAQYNTRLLVPTMKADLPRFSNVRSRTRNKYGYSLTAGEPSIDRYAFGDRNRKG